MFSGVAHADFGDLAFGGQLGVGAIELWGDGSESSVNARAVSLQPKVNLRVGLTDWLNLDTGVGYLLVDTESLVRSGGSIDLGLTGTLDVFAIVPELKIGLSLVMLEDGDDLRLMPGVDASLAVRYHFDFNWSVALGAEFNVAILPRYQGTLSFLYVLN